MNCEQIAFRFILATPPATAKALELKPRRSLSVVDGLSNAQGQHSILASYISHHDWVAEMREYLETEVRAATGVAFDPTADLAISIGAGVYVMDDDDIEYFYVREDDAFTCLGDYHIRENTSPPVSDRAADAEDGDWSGLAAVSLLPYEWVFKSPPNDDSPENRAKIARYILVNLMHFVAERSFWSALARDHASGNCLMETNWSAGDYIAPYYTAGLCRECLGIIDARVGTGQVAHRCQHWTAQNLNAAIRVLCELPDRWDRQVRTIRLLSSTLHSFLLTGVALAVATNLIAGYESNVTSMWSYLTGHWWPVVTVGLAVLAYVVSQGVVWYLQRTLPCPLPESDNPRRR